MDIGIRPETLNDYALISFAGEPAFGRKNEARLR
jgi:hypothetical protein